MIGATTQTLKGHTDYTVRVWEAATGATTQTLKGYTGSVWTVAFLLNGKLVASGLEDHTM